MRLVTPNTIRTLQRKLYIKAKQEPAYHFYALYDKVYRADVLAFAWRLVKANQGSPGVDGVAFEAIENGEGVERFLLELSRELKEQHYRASPVRRVMIPKADGSLRSLGTSEALFDSLEAKLPAHRERLFPPTETLSMFLRQALSTDRSCQRAVNDATVARVAGTCHALARGRTRRVRQCGAQRSINDTSAATLSFGQDLVSSYGYDKLGCKTLQNDPVNIRVWVCRCNADALHR